MATVVAAKVSMPSTVGCGDGFDVDFDLGEFNEQGNGKAGEARDEIERDNNRVKIRRAGPRVFPPPSAEVAAALLSLGSMVSKFGAAAGISYEQWRAGLGRPRPRFRSILRRRVQPRSRPKWSHPNRSHRIASPTEFT